MQKNVPKYTPDVGADGAVVGGGVEARGVVRAVQRPAHAAVVREPARGRVPPGARARRPPDRVTHLVLDLDPPDGDAFAMAVRAAHLVRQALADVGLEGAVKTSGAKGVHVFVPIDDAGAARRTRPRRRERSPRGPSARSRDRHDRVHEGGPRRQGVRRLDAGRRGHGRSPPTARGCGRACRCRSRSAGTTSTTSRPATSPCTPRSSSSATRDPWAEQMPAPQTLDRRAHRGGPRDPGRPGAGHARGQAPRPRPVAADRAAATLDMSENELERVAPLAKSSASTRSRAYRAFRPRAGADEPAQLRVGACGPAAPAASASVRNEPSSPWTLDRAASTAATPSARISSSSRSTVHA